MRELENFRPAMEELEVIYEAELMTVWEQGFYEDILEHLAEVDYGFSEKQIDAVLAMREKYDLDILHRRASG
jgi:hypothetical protein